MFDYSIEFTLLALFLAAVTIYGTKGKKITQLDVLYGLLLAAFYYVLLCVIDQYQTAKEGFKMLTEGYSNVIPSDHDDADYGDDESTNNSNHGTGIPTPPVGSPAPASLTDAYPTGGTTHHTGEAAHHTGEAAHHTGEAAHHTGEAAHHTGGATHHTSGATHHTGGATHHTGGATYLGDSVDHHHDSKSNKSHQMNHDRRPSINKHQMDNGFGNSTSSTHQRRNASDDDPITATAGVDAPINITINLDDDVTKEYKRVPHRHYNDPQFDDGLAADRLARLERRVEELVTRDLDNQYQEVVERSPEFSREPQIIYKYKERECPVCPLVAEKPWSEWEDAGHQRREDHERESWNAGMVGSRGGNNPLPVLP